MSDEERSRDARVELAVMVESLARDVVRDGFESDEEAEEAFDWSGYAGDAVREWVEGNFAGDQDLAWQALEEISTDVLLVERVWAGNWSLSAREALARLTDAAVSVGVLEERR